MILELTNNASQLIVEAVKERKEAEKNKMGREFASAYEAWAKLKRIVEMAKVDIKSIESIHGEVWSAVKDDNGDAVTVNLNALGNKAIELCVTFAEMAAEGHRAAEELRDKL